MAFCAFCGTELVGTSAVCPSPACRSRRATLQPGPVGSAPPPLDLDKVRWLLSRCHGRPWRIGDNHWEILDASGAIVARVETPNARELARFLVAAPTIVERLMSEERKKIL